MSARRIEHFLATAIVRVVVRRFVRVAVVVDPGFVQSGEKLDAAVEEDAVEPPPWQRFEANKLSGSFQ